MFTSSILTTIQLDRSLFSDDPEGALTEFLLAACSASELDLGLDGPSKMWTASYNTFREVCIRGYGRDGDFGRVIMFYFIRLFPNCFDYMISVSAFCMCWSSEKT